MSYSDNLYSYNDDSDDDYADQLSPSDGYFTSSNAIPSVPNVMVPDPTLQQSETAGESKAREANEESLLNSSGRALQPQASHHREASSYQPSTAPSTRSYSTRTTHTSSTSYAPASSRASAARQPIRTLPSPGRTPSVYSEAPPAYTPSPTSPISPANPSNQARNYSTFPSNMGVENERLLGRDPESMGQPDDEELPSPLWRRRIRRRLPPWLNLRMLVIAAVLLVVSIGFLANSLGGSSGERNKETIKPQNPAEEVERPSDPEPAPPISEPLQASYCQGAQYRFPDQIMSVEFSKARRLSFVQDEKTLSGQARVRVGGQVNLRQLDDGGYPRVVLEIVTNDKELLLDVHVDEAEQQMRISVPKKFNSKTTEEEPCVEMRATIWVPKDAELQELSVTGVHLDVLLLDDLSLQVEDFSRLSSIIGHVISGAEKPRTYENAGMSFDATPEFTYVPAKQSYTLDSRIIEVSTTSGKISGNWPLYDMLGLHSTAGNVEVSITPEPVLESNPKPAVLSMSSVSGYIHATEPIHTQDQVPIREYLVDVHSTSGEIHCALAFGSGIELKSTASNIAADLLPVIDQGKLSASNPAQLETVTTSGSTAIRILDPVWYGDRYASTEPKDIPFVPIGNGDPYDVSLPPRAVPQPFDCLQAVHKSTSADIGLRYPQSWVGDIQADATSGSLSVKGKDVRITKSTGGWPGSKMTAYKGQSGNASTISVRTLLGSLSAILGDE
ncbi:hypothetical protein BJ170DRAFT_604814 [Xylariales sp. AK1849]|nr:hypothetical protein BJ170DRAFT_604814 [Xylariales sp. AK1849]